MPLYVYECSECDHTFEEIQLMCDPPLTICEQCGKASLYRVIFPPRVSVRKSSDEITLGHLASRHRDEFSDDKKHHISEQIRPSLPQEKVQDRNTQREIRKMTPEQKATYIKTGMKPNA